MEKRRATKVYIPNLEQVSAEDLKKSDILKKVLFTEVPKSIEYANKNKKLFASIFEINDTNNYVEIHRKDWITALESCVNHYISLEDYEYCNKIKSLINSIKTSSSKLTINKREGEDE